MNEQSIIQADTEITPEWREKALSLLEQKIESTKRDALNNLEGGDYKKALTQIIHRYKGKISRILNNAETQNSACTQIQDLILQAQEEWNTKIPNKKGYNKNKKAFITALRQAKSSIMGVEYDRL